MSESAPLPHALNPLLAEALRKKGYDTLTAVQTAVAAPEVAERDLIVSSRTGSGKTVAYGLGMAATLFTAPSSPEGVPALPPAGKPLALIIAPTRELALQVQRELRWLYEAAGAIVVACVGGMDQRAERKHLERGVHIVVGTPGRLVDHLSRGALQLDRLAAVVLDEADEMLDLGFREDLELILAATPETRRTLLFSATLPKGIVALATKFQRNAARIEVASEGAGHADIEHRAVLLRPNTIEKGVVNLLRQTDSPAALVFCNTRDAVRHLHATLIERGFSAVILSGELGQHERNQALQALRDGRARVCIATDVAARGIDLPSLGLVIHADLPHDAEVLQHRSGRTGRAGRKGISVMLVPPSRRGKALRLFAEGGIRPEWVALPTADDIRALDRVRIMADDSAFADLSEADQELGAALLASRSAAEIAAALAHVFHARFPEPEEIDPLPVEEPRAARKDRNASQAGAPQLYRWFELGVGRQDKAEPKGILRMLTRAGGVERRFIGGIRIHDRTCEVEIALEVADKFEKRTASHADDDIRVRAITEPTPKARRHGGAQAAQDGPPREKKFRDKSFEDKPFREKPSGDRPFRDKPFREKPRKEMPFAGQKPRDERVRDERSKEDRFEGGKPEKERHRKKKSFGDAPKEGFGKPLRKGHGKPDPQRGAEKPRGKHDRKG